MEIAKDEIDEPTHRRNRSEDVQEQKRLLTPLALFDQDAPYVYQHEDKQAGNDQSEYNVEAAVDGILSIVQV